jgi:hypothetical protein
LQCCNKFSLPQFGQCRLAFGSERLLVCNDWAGCYRDRLTPRDLRLDLCILRRSWAQWWDENTTKMARIRKLRRACARIGPLATVDHLIVRAD